MNDNIVKCSKLILKIIVILGFILVFSPFGYNILPKMLKAVVIFCLIVIFTPFGYRILPKVQKVNARDDFIPGAVGSYLINLPSSKDRYNYVMPNIEKLGYPVHTIKAVDGYALSDDEVNKIAVGRIKNKKGDIGCALSHFKAYRKFLDSSYEYALIFEDDVSFNPFVLRGVVEELKGLRQYWNMVMFDIIAGESRYKTLLKLHSGNDMVLYGKSVYGAGGYLIDRKAAIRYLEKAMPISMPIDLYFTRSWELGTKFIGITNPLLVNQSFGNSDRIAINTKLNSQKLYKVTLSDELERTLIRIKISIMRRVSFVFWYSKLS